MTEPDGIVHEAELVVPGPLRSSDGSGRFAGGTKGFGKPKNTKSSIVERVRREVDQELERQGLEGNPLVKLIRIYMHPDTPLSTQVAAATALARQILPKLSEASVAVSGSLENRGAVLHGVVLADPNLRRTMENLAHRMSLAQLGDGTGTNRPKLNMPKDDALEGSQAQLESPK